MKQATDYKYKPPTMGIRKYCYQFQAHSHLRVNIVIWAKNTT